MRAHSAHSRAHELSRRQGMKPPRPPSEAPPPRERSTSRERASSPTTGAGEAFGTAQSHPATVSMYAVDMPAGRSSSGHSPQLCLRVGPAAPVYGRDRGHVALLPVRSSLLAALFRLGMPQTVQMPKESSEEAATAAPASGQRDPLSTIAPEWDLRSTYVLAKRIWPSLL
jgi:hypothetical protein